MARWSAPLDMGSGAGCFLAANRLAGVMLSDQPGRFGIGPAQGIDARSACVANREQMRFRSARTDACVYHGKVGNR